MASEILPAALEAGGTEPTSPIASLSSRLQEYSIDTAADFSTSNASNDSSALREGGRKYLRGDQVPAAVGKRGKKKGWFWEHGEEIYCEDDGAWLRLEVIREIRRRAQAQRSGGEEAAMWQLNLEQQRMKCSVDLLCKRLRASRKGSRQ